MESTRPITPHVATVPGAPLTCGEFHQEQSYTNWRPRGSGDWLLIYTLAGAGGIASAGRKILLGERQAVLYRPEASQDYSTAPEFGYWHLRWVHFTPKPHWEPWLAWPEIGRGTGHLHLGLEAAERFRDALGRLLVVSRLGGVAAQELGFNALEEALIWAHRDTAGDRWLAVDPRIRKAIDTLAANPARSFSIAELAAHCGLSASRFGHLFREQVHLTPRQFCEKLRLELAMQLLSHTGMSVSEVAWKAGFTDPLYFSRRFVRAFGKPPGAARPVARRSGERS